MNVFLSYARDDSRIVQKVRNHLVHNGFQVFNPIEDISTGESIVASINKSIEESDAVLVFVSKNAEKSSWVNQEIALSVSRKSEGKSLKIIPLLVEKNIDAPFFLREYQHLDISNQEQFSSSMEKLATAISAKQLSSPDYDLESHARRIELEQALFRLQKENYHKLKQYKIRQLYSVVLIATVLASVVVSAGMLGWAAKVEISKFSWVLPFLMGAGVSLLASLLYSRREKKHNDAEDEIRRLRDSTLELESRNGK